MLMLKITTSTLLLIVPCLSSATPPPPNSSLYVPPPPFVDPNTDDPGSANHLLQGFWDTSNIDHFAFEIKLMRFRVIRANCDWLHWEWLDSTDELIDGKLVLTRLTIRVVAEPGETACLKVPMSIHIDFGSPPKYDVAKVSLGVGWTHDRDLQMTRHIP